MPFTTIRDGPQRTAALALSYLALIAVGVFSWSATDIHVGALAALPLLFIAYYAPLWVALATAFASGIALTLVDSTVVPHGSFITISPVPDALAFSLTLCAVVVVAERLRTRTIQNAALRESLHDALNRAEQDALTGIGNRRFLMRRLRTTLRTMKPHEAVGLIFADLDGFKWVNDTAGHEIGDRVLLLAAERLRHAIRARDVLARIGGDEFAILIERLPDNAETQSMLEKIEAQFDDPFTVDRQEFRLGITLGLAAAPADGMDAHSLLRAADSRMYRKKEAKRAARSSS